MMRPVSNDTTQLAPRPPSPGRTLTFDFPGLLIGVME
jgi:hypothetical protein